jgi:hypothetical protein
LGRGGRRFKSAHPDLVFRRESPGGTFLEKKMKKPKIDGVIETVHYSPDGQITYVRAYQRRGASFSDVVLIKREDLVRLLNSGEQYYTGERVYAMGTEFKTFERLQVVPSPDGNVILTASNGARDDLGVTPLL